MKDIFFTEYEDADLDGCVDLLSRTFPGCSDKWTFQWRFLVKNRKKPILILAKHKGKIISFNSWIPWEFSYDGEIYLGYQSGESATDGEYRKRGIWGNALDYGHKIAMNMNIDFLFGFPSTLSYGAFYKAGYYPVATCFFYVRPINPFKKKKQLKLNTESEYTACPILFQPDRITPLVNKEYYTWRYTENTKEYLKLEYCENNNKAIFFCRENKWKKIPEVLLMDVQVTSYNEIFLNNAFNLLDEHFTRKAFYMRTFFNENTDRGKTLRRYFSTRIKSKFDVFTVKPLSARIANNILLNINSWDIMPHCVDEY